MKLDCTVMVLHGVLDDGQAQSGTAGGLGVALVHAVEALEDAALVLRGDADAVVCDGQLRAAARQLKQQGADYALVTLKDAAGTVY